MKTFDLKKHLPTVVPSAYFILLLLAGSLGSSTISVCLCMSFITLISANLFLQSTMIHRAIGLLFILLAFCGLLAMGSDAIRGTASWGYLFGVLMALLTLFMATRLIVKAGR